MATERVRIATVGYLNARPLTEYLDPERVELVTGIPAEIARMLQEGEVDVALVPVAAVLPHEDLRIVPGFAIGADGPVQSVLFVSETPVEEWTRLVLDGESRTSAMLARLLVEGPLAERVASGLEVVQCAPGAAVELATGTTAGLVIGDAARELPDRLPYRIDLAGLWKDWTGLPFVFAVWAARGSLSSDVRAHLREAAERGVAEIGTHYTGLDREYLGSALRYPLDDRAIMGLRRFASLAKAAGLSPREHLDLFGPAETFAARTDVDELLARVLGGASLSVDEATLLEAEARPSDLMVAADLVRRDHVANERVAWEIVADIDLAKGPVLEQAQAASEAGADRLLILGSEALDLAGHAELLRTLRPFGALALPSAVVARLSGGVDVLVEAGLCRVMAGGVAGLDVEALAGAQLLAGFDLPVDVVLASSTAKTPEARIASIERVRALISDGVQVERVVLGALRTEKASRVEGETATEFLRTVAVARLMLPTVHLEGSWATHGLGTAQMALHAGCDRFPPLRLLAGHDLVGLEARKKAFELHIHEAGFEPVHSAMGAREATPRSVHSSAGLRA